MSLRPKQIDFEETWQRIRVTVNNVVSVQPVTNKDWNDCFSYPLREGLDPSDNLPSETLVFVLTM